MAPLARLPSVQPLPAPSQAAGAHGGLPCDQDTPAESTQHLTKPVAGLGGWAHSKV